MSDVIVDASLAVQWVVPEAHTREARALLQDWDIRQVRRVVPGWFACEIGNVFYKRLGPRSDDGQSGKGRRRCGA